MKKALIYIVAATLFVVFGYVLCTYRNKLCGKGNITHTDTTTVVVYDTISITKPIHTTTMLMQPKRYPAAHVPILLTMTDTMYVPYYVDSTLVIPIHQREYAGDNYQAWVSGFEPRLDSIDIFAPTTTHYIEKRIDPKNLFTVNTIAGIHYNRTAEVFAGVSLRYERYKKLAIEAGTGIIAGQQGAGIYVEGRIILPIFTAGY